MKNETCKEQMWTSETNDRVLVEEATKEPVISGEAPKTNTLRLRDPN